MQYLPYYFKAHLSMWKTVRINCCVGDHILQEFYTLYLTRFRTYKIARPTPDKNLGGKGASDRETRAAKSLDRAIFFLMTTLCIAFYESYLFMVAPNSWQTGI
jgi:hypothetical protein